MAKKNKAKKTSFRQRLRNQSAERLADIEQAVVIVVDTQLLSAGCKISSLDVMRLISGGQTKTLREDLITQISHQTEAELESLFHRHMELLKEDSDGDKKEAK